MGPIVIWAVALTVGSKTISNKIERGKSCTNNFYSYYSLSTTLSKLSRRLSHTIIGPCRCKLHSAQNGKKQSHVELWLQLSASVVRFTSSWAMHIQIVLSHLQHSTSHRWNLPLLSPSATADGSAAIVKKRGSTALAHVKDSLLSQIWNDYEYLYVQILYCIWVQTKFLWPITYQIIHLNTKWALCCLSFTASLLKDGDRLIKSLSWKKIRRIFLFYFSK